MASVLRRLVAKDLLHPPPWLMDNLMFEGVVGSTAYGCNNEGDTDEDLVGMAIPPKGMVFPHLEGYIPGFGTKPPTFNSFQQHHIFFSETKTQYDVCIYGIVNLFQLCRDNNPAALGHARLLGLRPRHHSAYARPRRSGGADDGLVRKDADAAVKEIRYYMYDVRRQ